MRGQNDFVMDTKGYCLLCLQNSQARDPSCGFGELEDGHDNSSNVFSLQRVCRYLRLNMRNVFKDLIAAAPKMTSSTSSAAVFEKSELKGVLCEECSEMTETFSKIALELEVLQMTLDSLVKKMMDKVEGIERNQELMDGFKREMLSSPQTLIHYGIVEQLRTETLKKCSVIMEKSQPRVILEKLGLGMIDPQNRDGGSPEGDAPELGEATPVISSVRGSYHADDSGPVSTPKSNPIVIPSDPGIEKKPSVEIIDFDADPELPVSVKVEQEMIADDDARDEEPIIPHVAVVSPPTPLSPEVPSPPGSPRRRKDCKYCHRSFRQACLRVDHERTIHEGILFQCGKCPSTFKFRSTRSRHQKDVHNMSVGRGKAAKGSRKQTSRPLQNNLPETSKSNAPGRKIASTQFRDMAESFLRFQCEYCPMMFWHISNKSRHMKNDHNHLTKRQRRQLANDAQSSSSCNNLQIGESEGAEI